VDYHTAIVEPRPLSYAPPLTCLFIIQVAVPRTRVVTNVVEWMVVGIVRSNCGRITVVTTSLLTVYVRTIVLLAASVEHLQMPL